MCAMIVKPLTGQQQTVLTFVADFAAEHGFPPTLREIGDAIGLVHVNAVRGHVAALEKKGYITKVSDKARSIQVIAAPSIVSRVKRILHRFARTDEGVLHAVVYGVGLVTRGRREVFSGRMGRWMDAALERRAVEHGWKILEKRIEPDRVILALEVWPNHSPQLVVSRIRQEGQSVRRRRRTSLLGGGLWAKGYAITTDLSQLDAMVERLLEEEAPTG
jgi:hypothetical protein